MFKKLPGVIPGVTITEQFRGHNESKQYIGCQEYPSAIAEKMEKIQIEIGLKEALFIPSESKIARTIAVNPFKGRPLLPEITVNTMALKESFAEKARAALTRREPAIRDFFDLFYAGCMLKLNFHDSDFLDLVKAKINVPGNDPIDVSSGRRQELNQQLEGRLRLVLRHKDYDKFNLEEAFELVRNIAKALSA